MVDDQRLSQIKQGVSTKEDVLSALGTPSAAGTFDDQNWYYIGQIISKEAFFKPEVVDRRVIEIAFNDNIVSEVRELKKEDGVDVALVSRTTPTKGSDFTMLEQFFGNLGRFNSDAAKR